VSEHTKSAAELRGTTGSRPAAQRIQTKLAVSDRHDPMEHEADAVASRVVAGQPAPAVSRMAGLEKKKEPTAQRAAAPEKKEPKGTVQRAAAPEKKKPDVQRVAVPEKRKPEAPVQRQVDELENVQTKSAGDSGPAMGHLAQRAVDSKGSGRPLDSGVRSRIESSLGTDMSHVRVHDDPSARAAASALNARAFTHGSDIWMGPGESSGDLGLLAHEATHVVQQGSAAQRMVQRAKGAPPTAVPPTTAAAALPDLKTFRLPPIKERHRRVYDAWAQQGKLKRVPGYPFKRGSPDQRDSVWLADGGVTLPQERLDTIGLTPSFAGTKTVEVGTHTRTGNLKTLTNFLKTPQWDRTGNWEDFPMEVDHIVELQVGGWDGSSGAANTIENMELLDKSSNASAGARTKESIRNNVVRYLEATTGLPAKASDVEDYLKDNPIDFDRVVPGTEGSAGGRWWSRAEIQAGDHLTPVKDIGNVGEFGSAASFALVSAGGTLLAQWPGLAQGQTIPVPAAPDHQHVAGLIISSISVQANAADAAKNAQVGSVQATLELPPQLKKVQTPFPVPLHKMGQYSAYLGNPPAIGGTDFAPLSLITFEPPVIDGAELVAGARLTPSLPLLGTTPIDVVLRGGHLALVYFYSAGELALPLPGIHIDDATLGIMVGTEGFRAEGAVYFSVDRLGHGSLTAGVDGSGNFEAGGSFDFDSKLFDQARIEIWYRDRSFGGRGTLRITQPGKVRGIRSLDATATFSETHVEASGTVAPDIPGVETATLGIEYSEAEGLVIRGSATLGRGVPGISSGSLDAEVRRPTGAPGFQLFAHGTAVPAIPGINTTLEVTYDNGALTLFGHADYSRGLLSGALDLGVTNRVLDAAGQPTDEIGIELKVYGGGTLTVRIAPWLQGTVGVRFAPNGEVTVAGEIALPSQTEIFSRKQINKSLFNIAIQVPIFPGVVAEIGGGLSAEAGIGPGVIDQLRLGITYNPAHEEQTHVTGDAHLNIPADAGLRLAVRAGIGLGITGASATGGLEIGGMLGLAGAAEAGVHIDWLPSTGLRIDAYGDIHAEPIFRFDISGYVSVRVLGFEVYGNTWRFASYEFGSNLRFGIRFPIHYVQGQPFDISLNDVEFTVPDIDPGAILHGLVDRIA